MADPQTPNVQLVIPLRGADPGTWDVPVNANTTAIDGYLGGVVTVSLSNAPITLSAPTGVVTPGAGPFQSQNRILKFTGALTSSVTVTLPLPGEYTIQNLTTGNFVVVFAAASAGNVVSTPQGSVMHVWNDGSNVYLVKNVIPGALTFLGGVSAVPSWIAACSIPPYLLCDGNVYNFSVYPALGGLYLGSFGGNGITTFGVEDLRGRVPLAYDGTGTRITVAGCGINGQTLGAVGGGQNETLITANLPPYTPSGAISNGAISVVPATVGAAFATSGPRNNGPLSSSGGFGTNDSAVATQATSTFAGTAQGGVSTPVITVQPSQVSGIWLVAT